MKKYIITRIGLNTAGKRNSSGIHLENDNEYMLRTVTNMLDFTYPSIKNQTAKGIVWVFFTGARFTYEHKKLIEDIVEVPIVFIKDIEYKQTKKQWEHEESIVMRLDSDDFMHPQLVEKVEGKLLDKYDGDNIVICHPIRGYKFYSDLSLSEFEAPNIAIGLGVISNCGAGVLHDHTKLEKTYAANFPGRRVVLNNIDDKERFYLYRRHEDAHSFACDADPRKVVKVENPEKILEDFGVFETRFWRKKHV